MKVALFTVGNSAQLYFSIQGSQGFRVFGFQVLQFPSEKRDKEDWQHENKDNDNCGNYRTKMKHRITENNQGQ